MALFERALALSSAGISRTAKYPNAMRIMSGSAPPPATLPALPASPSRMSFSGGPGIPLIGDPPPSGPIFSGPGGSPISTGGGRFGPLASAGCELLPAHLRALCRAGVNTLLPPTQPTQQSECPRGTVRVGNTCIDPTAALPGGRPLTFPRSGTPIKQYGNAVVGSFGIPALEPAVTAVNVHSCPPGAVLGADNLCYQKGSIPRAFRKHRPAPRPPMTAGDAKALRRIGTLQRKAKRLAATAGFVCSTKGRGARKSTTRRRK